MTRIKWKENQVWAGPGAYLFNKINNKNNLTIVVMCRFSDKDKVEGYRSEVKVRTNGESSVGYIYDVDLEIAKFKSLIKAKELGWDFK